VSIDTPVLYFPTPRIYSEKRTTTTSLSRRRQHRQYQVEYQKSSTNTYTVITATTTSTAHALHSRRQQLVAIINDRHDFQVWEKRENNTPEEHHRHH
jgi:hypothetical protein